MPRTKLTHAVFFIVAQIRGLGFLDMTRYDTCCPATEEESARIERACSGDGARWVIFRRFVPAGVTPAPCLGRWASFNIKVLPQAFQSYGEADLARKALEVVPGSWT